jgi:hypothetical protein
MAPPSPSKTNAASGKTPAPSGLAAAASSNGKPVYVCPPKSTLIPNYPYCVYADRSVVDAIPLPANLSAPAQTNAKP